MLQTAFRIFNQCQNKAFIIIRCWGCNWWVSILMPCLAAFRWKILAFKKNFEFSIHVEAVKSNKGRIYGTLANNDSKNDLELIERKNKHREFFKPLWNENLWIFHLKNNSTNSALNLQKGEFSIHMEKVIS